MQGSKHWIALKGRLSGDTEGPSLHHTAVHWTLWPVLKAVPDFPIICYKCGHTRDYMTGIFTTLMVQRVTLFFCPHAKNSARSSGGKMLLMGIWKLLPRVYQCSTSSCTVLGCPHEQVLLPDPLFCFYFWSRALKHIPALEMRLMLHLFNSAVLLCLLGRPCWFNPYGFS